MKRITFFLVILIGFVALMSAPGAVLAQDGEAQSNVSAVIASDDVSGTLEISPEAIQSLLDGEAGMSIATASTCDLVVGLRVISGASAVGLSTFEAGISWEGTGSLPAIHSVGSGVRLI